MSDEDGDPGETYEKLSQELVRCNASEMANQVVEPVRKSIEKQARKEGGVGSQHPDYLGYGVMQATSSDYGLKTGQLKCVVFVAFDSTSTCRSFP